MMPTLTFERDPVLTNMETPALEKNYKLNRLLVDSRFEEWIEPSAKGNEDPKFFDNQADALLRLIRAAQVQYDYALELGVRNDHEIFLRPYSAGGE